MNSHEVLAIVASGNRVDDRRLETALYNMCDDLHACDCTSCPFYAMRRGDIHRTDHWGGCDGFKDGAALLKAFRAEYEPLRRR